MPSLGTIVSTALTDGGAPVFEKNTQVDEVAAQVTGVSTEVNDLKNEIAGLVKLVTQLTQNQPNAGTDAVVREVVVERLPEDVVEAPETDEDKPELTTAEKSAKTKADNKAKKAETTVKEDTKDGSTQKGN